MNLYLRLIWIILRSFFKPQINFVDKLSLGLRILPNDIDINFHLNNGRYLTLLDLLSVYFFIRTGVLKQSIARGFRPMIGGAIISYRKGLSLFEPCTLSMQLKAWDEKWNYFKFEFKNSKGQLSAAGYLKGAFVSKKGIIPTEVLNDMFDYKSGECEFPIAVTNWIKSEKATFLND